MQPYRAAADAPPPLVYDYRPLGRVASVLLPLLFLVVAGCLLVAAWARLESSHFHCERAAGVCTLDESWPVGARHRSWPIAAIVGGRATSSRSKSGLRVTAHVIVRDEGDLSLFTSDPSSGLAARAVAAIDAFVANPEQSTLDIDGEAPSYALAAMVGAVGLLMVVVAWLMTQTARVSVDRRAQTLSLVRRRWPLSPAERCFPLPVVRDAYVETRPVSKSVQYRLSLMIDGELEPVPVLEQTSANLAVVERGAAAIRAMIDEARDGAR